MTFGAYVVRSACGCYCTYFALVGNTPLKMITEDVSYLFSKGNIRTCQISSHSRCSVCTFNSVKLAYQASLPLPGNTTFLATVYDLTDPHVQTTVSALTTMWNIQN